MTDSYQLASAYKAIHALAPTVQEMKTPTQGNSGEAYTPPRPAGPRPPCNLTWIDLEQEILGLLQITATQLRRDTKGLYGRPVPGLAGHAGWLAAQADTLATTEWINSSTWFANVYQCDPDGTTIATATIMEAQRLTEVFDPPIKHPPAGTAVQMSIETGVPVETIKTWRKRGKIKGFKADDGTYRYRLEEIQWYKHASRFNVC